MNFDAIVDFSHAVGILTEEGSLVDQPAPYMHSQIEREVFVAAHNASLEVYLQEHSEIIEKLQTTEQEAVDSQPKLQLILA